MVPATINCASLHIHPDLDDRAPGEGLTHRDVSSVLASASRNLVINARKRIDRDPGSAWKRQLLREAVAGRAADHEKLLDVGAD